MSHFLKKSENRLVWSFVLGAIIFLIIFEGIFLWSRYIAENQHYEDIFIKETNQIFHKNIGDKNIRIPFGIGIEFIETDKKGNIVNSQIKELSVGNISEILTEDALEKIDISNKKITHCNGYIVRKFEKNNSSLYFLTPEKNTITSLQRDVIRFLILDIILVLPIWFMMRIHIRRTLKPVKDNIDTMQHFVNDAGHELKTPLAIISGNLQILRDSPKMDYELVEESLKWIDAMNDSISGLLELSRISTPEKDQKTNLKKIIEDEISRAKNDNNIEIINNFSENFEVAASQKHLSILIRNLLENAIKYNKTHGKVYISLNKNTLVIEDTGIGMDEDNIKRIFDRFYRINQHSSVSWSGIGMTLVEKVIKLYNWKINIQSQLDIGTKISVTF